MVKREEVVVGSSFDYPHPDGVGLVRTFIRRVLRPTSEYPEGRVQHESAQIGQGALVTMEVFCANALKPQEPR